MTVTVAYIAVSQGPLTIEYAARFCGSYLACPAGADHRLLIACNGGPLPREAALLFDSVDCGFFPRVNHPGWDLAGFIDVAQQFPCDMLVCLGESVYFHREGWLARLVAAWEKYGPGMYGLFSSFMVRPHLNTTAFAVDPRLLLEYPKPKNREDRYNFEHGEHSFWRHVRSKGKPTMLVTWDGCWTPIQWRTPRDILWRGSQQNCLAFCNHADRYFAADDKIRRRWAYHADTLPVAQTEATAA